MMRPSNESRMDTRGSCPDPEVLAAWLEQGVSARERVEVEAHLAGCDDCRYLMAHVLETRNAVRDAPIFTPRDEKVVPIDRARRRKTAWSVAAVLTAAAMLALAFVAPPFGWPWRGNSIDSKLADLAAAVGSERTVEARLTGGFVHGPLRAAVRSGGSSAALDNWTLFAAAGKIREDAKREPSAPHLHALGVAHLVLGQSDDAVRALEDAVAENAQNARYHSDLAAAYLARAHQLDRPDDYGRALGAADRALKISDAAIEARFNRALALESLFLAERAREAWQDYLKRDTASDWATEARQRLQKLQAAAAPGEIARNNSPPLITPTSVEVAFDWLVRDGLLRWAEAVAAADAALATTEQALLTKHATQLSAASGDPFPLALAQITTRPDPSTAATVRDVASALRELALDDVAAAEPELRAACADAFDALTLVCDVELGMLDVVHRDRAAASRRLADALRESRARGFVYVERRAERLEGFQKMFDGDYAGAIPAYRAAFDTFQSGKYGGQAANIAMQLADLYDFSGLKVDGWRWRYLALQAAAAVGSPWTRHMTRISASVVFGREGEYEASQAFASELRDASGLVSEPRRITGLIAFARVAVEKKDYRAAKETLTAVMQTLSGTKDFRLQRSMPDVLALMGTILAAEGDTASAVESLTRALETMGPERPAQRAHALIERARVRSVAGYAPAAESDVRSAIVVLRNVASQLEPVQLDDAQTAFETVGDLVAARVELQGQSGLFLAEQLREVLDAAPASSRIPDEDELTKRLARAEREAVVFFLFSRRALLAWVSVGGRVHYVERPLDPDALEQSAGVLGVQVARGAREDVLREALGGLYDQLLRGLPGIDSAASILIVPDGPLNMIPFAALFDRIYREVPLRTRDRSNRSEHRDGIDLRGAHQPTVPRRAVDRRPARCRRRRTADFTASRGARRGRGHCRALSGKHGSAWGSGDEGAGAGAAVGRRRRALRGSCVAGVHRRARAPAACRARSGYSRRAPGVGARLEAEWHPRGACRMRDRDQRRGSRHRRDQPGRGFPSIRRHVGRRHALEASRRRGEPHFLRRSASCPCRWSADPGFGYQCSARMPRQRRLPAGTGDMDRHRRLRS